MRKTRQFAALCTEPIIWALVALLSSVAVSAKGQEQDLSKVKQKAHRLSDTLWWLEPQPPLGGNLVVSAGEDGILMVDDQMMPITPNIKESVAGIRKGNIDFVINTHYHYDHAGGNAAFGLESLIVAHEAVRTRLLEGREAGQRFMAQPLPTEAIPVVTFRDSITLHWNGEIVDATYLGNPSHTDGDAVIFFHDSNVIHTGDQFVNLNGFPYIDRDVGGSATGLRDNIAAILAMVDDDTRIVPGHGPVTSKAELQAYHDRVAETIAHVAEQKAAGKTLEEIQKAGLPDRYSQFTGFMPLNVWIQSVFDSLDD